MIPGAGQLVLLSTTHRVPAGLLSWPAWRLLREADVVCADPGGPQLPHLAAAGVPIQPVAAGGPAQALAESLYARAAGGRTVVWVVGPDGDPGLHRALAERLVTGPAGAPAPEVEVLPGSYDLPGARLLDVVATMDRLRSPGGCPWDAEQTHATLAPYLLEESYEALGAIETGDLDDLREELGDVLLQVVFHARLAQEAAADGWGIDDVAGGLVDKLIRRHPHVFADTDVADAAQVEANWATIKTAEKGRTSVTDGVPLGQPALALAAKLQKRAVGLGLPAELVGRGGGTPAEAVAAATAAVGRAAADGVDTAAAEDAVGELLFAAVTLARSAGVDAEAALRGRVRRFRDQLAATERAVRGAGRDAASLDARSWHEHWAAHATGAPTPRPAHSYGGLGAVEDTSRR